MKKEAKDFLSYEGFQKFAFEAGIEGIPDPALQPAFINPSLMKFGHCLFNLGLEKGTSEARKEAFDYIRKVMGSMEANLYIAEVDPPAKELIEKALDCVISAAMNGRLDGDILWSVTRALEAAKVALPDVAQDAEP